MTTTSPVPVTDGHIYEGSSLELVDLTMAYGDIDVLRDVSLTVAPGTTTCIIGPSGSGKSTLLRGVNRLHEPKSDSPSAPTTDRATCRAASSSASRSLARSPWSPRSCCSTRPRARSTPSS